MNNPRRKGRRYSARRKKSLWLIGGALAAGAFILVGGAALAFLYFFPRILETARQEKEEEKSPKAQTRSVLLVSKNKPGEEAPVEHKSEPGAQAAPPRKQNAAGPGESKSKGSREQKVEASPQVKPIHVKVAPTIIAK